MPPRTPTAPDAESPASPSHGRAAWISPLLAVALTVTIALSRLLVNPTFYFADDTQTGTVGQWWQLGQRLASGSIPMLDPHAWTAGNYFAEGQWGLFNPGIWVVALWARTVDDPVLMATAVKIIALGLLALGTHLLARSFGASPIWAGVAGVLVPLGGFTVYMDAASWTTGLLAATAFTFAWWGLRRLVEAGRGPLAYLLAAWVLITLGYVFGVIILILVLAESLVRAAVTRDRVRVLRTLGAGAYGALLTIAVYLPGVLTAPVTVRNSLSISNDGFLAAELGDMLAASTATASAAIPSWNTPATGAPLVFIAWALPALALLVTRRTALRVLIPALVLGAIMFVVVTGPSQVGPLRWPVRFMPYLVISVVVVFAVVATSATRSVPSVRRLWAALAISLGASWYSVLLTPANWRGIAVAAVVQLVGIALLFLALRLRRERLRELLAATTTAGIAALLVVPQLIVFSGTPLPQLGVIRSVEDLADTVPDGVDDAIVVGDIYAGWRDAATYEERLVGNQWYFADTRVSSLYTVLPFAAYTNDLCADLRGATCPEALDTLLEIDPATGLDVAELLGVNTFVVMKSSFPDGLPLLPTDWTVTADRTFTWVVERDDSVDTAGGVVWTDAGTRVSVTEISDAEVRFTVDSVGADAIAVLSRLAWPGYTVDGATLTDATRGYLLTVDLSDAQPGDSVTVRFRPPGWTLEMAALILALGALVAWPLADLLVRRRRDSVSEERDVRSVEPGTPG